ncbi:serine protease [Colwellia sp. 20A7]|uniref:serine protease n=1 Tax=Colwellia sp. 20A7 TaxID=2689569 RepID=UPI00135BD581|nr:serine protease [Colwellia sp. 20A7]
MNYIIAMIVILCTLPVDAENLSPISKLLQESNANMEKAIDRAVEKSHQISSERMQRILEHQKKFEPKIVGGRETEVNAYPWAVSLAYSDSSGLLSSYCGASLIAKSWLLTAAHCEVYTSDVVIIGRHDLTTNTGRIYKINRFVPHPLYNSDTSDNDIALVELSENAENTLILNIYTQLANVTAGKKVTVIGWGRLSEGGITSKTLQEVTVPVVANNICKSAYSNLTENMICAGEKGGGKDSCQGDSGGPLLFKVGDAWSQVGVVSFGTGCARENYYGVYTRVANYGKWINTVLSGL